MKKEIACAGCEYNEYNLCKHQKFKGQRSNVGTPGMPIQLYAKEPKVVGKHPKNCPLIDKD